MKKYEDASKEFKHAISVDQKQPDAHYGLALCCLKLNKNEDAVRNIENAVLYSFEEYSDKIDRRKQRKYQRLRELEEAIAKGEKSPPTGA